MRSRRSIAVAGGIALLVACAPADRAPRAVESGTTLTLESQPVSVCSLANWRGEGGAASFDGQMVRLKGSLVGDPNGDPGIVDPGCTWGFVGLGFSSSALDSPEGQALLQTMTRARQVKVGDWPTQVEIEIEGRYTAQTGRARESGRIDVARIFSSRQATARSASSLPTTGLSPARQQPCSKRMHPARRELLPCA